MKKTTKKTKTESKEKEAVFEISLTLGDKTYTGKGGTALEALQSIKRPEKIVSKGVIRMSDGLKSKQLLMYPIRLKRLFWVSTQPIIIKSLVMGMK